MVNLATDRPCHVAHLVHGLHHGGLETVVRQLVAGLPAPRYRHTILCLSECGTLPVVGAELYPLHKQEGQDWGLYGRLWRLLRQLRPDVLHSCNLATCEFIPLAAMAGVARRIHVEHGRDSYDPEGKNRTYRLLRRVTGMFAQRVVAVSPELEQWLIDQVGVARCKVVRVNNGVDTTRFYPAAQAWDGEVFHVGFVGRLAEIKNPLLLVHLLVLWRQHVPQARVRLHIVGDGPLRAAMEQLACQSGVMADMVWWGWREDVADCLRQWQVLVLPSLAEGTPLTVLEAMASGLPVVASRVGGLPDLVEKNMGQLIAPNDVQGFMQALEFYRKNSDVARQHGQTGRARVKAHYSLTAMVDWYDQLFNNNH